MIKPAADPRHARLASLRAELLSLHRSIRWLAVGTAERDALAERIGALAGCATALAEELES